MGNLKHTIRDGLIWLFIHSGVVALQRLFLRRKGPLVRVLSLHDVTDAAWFDALMSLLAQKYHVLTPEEFHNKTFANDQINILLTFDDGYQSWVDTVLPILHKYNAKAMFFVSSGLLDSIDAGEGAAEHFVRDRLKLTKPRNLLTWDGIGMLAAAGHTVGGHTVTHVSLRQLSEAEVEREVRPDKQVIESMLDTTITDFAYPFGRKSDMSRGTHRQISELGYTHIFSALSGFYRATEHTSTTPIPRTLLEDNQSLTSINYWIKGGYDPISTLRS